MGRPDGRMPTKNHMSKVVDAIQTGLIIPAHDYVSVAYPNATTEVFTYKVGGSGGTTVATVTLTYTDSTKESLSTVEKT